MKRQQIIDIREAVALLEYVKLRHLNNDVYIRKQKGSILPPVLIPHTFVDGKDIYSLPTEHPYRLAIAMIDSKESIAIQYMGYKIKELPKDIEEVNIELLEPNDFYKQLALRKLSPTSIKKSHVKIDTLKEKYAPIKKGATKRLRKKFAKANFKVTEKIIDVIHDSHNPIVPRIKFATKYSNYVSSHKGSEFKFTTEKEHKAKKSKQNRLIAKRKILHDFRMVGQSPFKKEKSNKALVCVKHMTSGVIQRIQRKSVDPEIHEYCTKGEWKLYTQVNTPEIQQVMPSTRAKYRYEMGKRKLKNITHKKEVKRISYIEERQTVDTNIHGEPYIFDICDSKGTVLRTELIPQVVNVLKLITKDDALIILGKSVYRIEKYEDKTVYIRTDFKGIVKQVLQRIPIAQKEMEKPKTKVEDLLKLPFVKKAANPINSKRKVQFMYGNGTKDCMYLPKRVNAKNLLKYVDTIHPGVTVISGIYRLQPAKEKKWRCPMPEKKVTKVKPVKSK